MALFAMIATGPARMSALSNALCDCYPAAVPASLCDAPRSMHSPTPTSTDEQLMVAYVASSDARAFGLLFERYAPRVFSFFSRTFGKRDVAEDLVQCTFLKLHVGRGSYQSDRPFRPWLFTIAARVRLDELRRRYRVPAAASDDEVERVASREASPAELSEATEERDRIEAAFARLSSAERTLIHLHRGEGLSFAEIGGIVGAREGAARLRAFRAYEKLRALLEGSSHG
jgi:RNA polymerase sigma-70 factor (ECF subfamily)